MVLPQVYTNTNPCTEADYSAFEQTAFGRWEYVRGEIRAMAGGTENHALAAANIVRVLGNALVPKGCRVYGSDLKIHTGDGVDTFPDVAVVCGERQYYQGRQDVITNPVLLGEVLSPSTTAYDRGDKFAHYQAVPTLTDYLLVSPDEPRLTLHTHAGEQWTTHKVTGLDRSMRVASLDITLALSDVYALLAFPAA